MTDEQIIKALECCSSSNVEHCRKCPLISQKDELFSCLYQKQILSLDLINRQKIENERLEKGLTEYKLRLKMSECTVDEIKSEAIKDFAERLKRKIWHSGWCNLERTITPEIITNLVKEMTEEK